MKKLFFLLIAMIAIVGCKSNEPEQKTPSVESFQKAIDLLEKDSAATVQTLSNLGFTYTKDDSDESGSALVFTKEKWNGFGFPGEFYRVAYKKGQSTKTMYHIYLGQGNIAAANVETYISMATTSLPLPGTGNETFKDTTTSTYATGTWEKGAYQKTMLVQYYALTGYTFVRFTAEVREE